MKHGSQQEIGAQGRLGHSMALPRLQSQAVNVLVLGSFNPRIFEPLWLVRNGLVPEDEVGGAERELLDQEFARIVLPWATVVVLGERLQVESTGDVVNASQVRDLVVGVLRLLPHTPVSGLSIQHGAHIPLGSVEQWHAVGDKLAPKELWSDILVHPGLLDLAMQGERSDDLDGFMRVRIQPSALVHPGIFMNVNNQFQTKAQEGGEPARQAADQLGRIWNEAEKSVEAIRSTLLERLID